MYLTRSEIEELHAIFLDHASVQQFEITQDTLSGVGTNTFVTVPVKNNIGKNSKLVIQISDESSW